MSLLPIRQISWSHFEAWDVDCLADASGQVSVIDAMNANYDSDHQLFIDIEPIDTLKQRIEEELKRPLNPDNHGDRVAFEALMVHLSLTEMCKYEELDDEHISGDDLQAIRQLFEQGKVCADGLFVVSRGYQACIVDEVSRLGDDRWALGWSN
jgi:hypothetical protein